MPRPFPSPDAAAEERIEAIVRRYPWRVPRADLAAVEALLEADRTPRPPHVVAVVGTNGKTSTATYLSRLLEAGGVAAGLTVSPHLRHWNERVVVRGRPCGGDELAAALERLDSLASGRDGLRFFDLVTVAASRFFAEAGADVGVFEAGVGGRLDAVAALGPDLVVLTGIARDHTELLGEDEAGILREKLLVAPPHAPVVSAPLPRPLAEAAHALRPQVELLAAGPGERFLDANFRLAVRAAELLGVEPRVEAVEREVSGRLQSGTTNGVAWIVDAAHNEQGWRALLAELAPQGPFVAVVSVSADRDARTFAGLLAASGLVRRAVATTAWEGRSLPADELAAALREEALDTTAVADPKAAVAAGLREAAGAGVPLAVLGSAYLVGHALETLLVSSEEPPGSPEPPPLVR